MDEKLLNIDDKFETWAFIEIMGHSRAVGRVSERKFGVNVMLQVDVPDSTDGFSHSELYSPASIFSIKPTTEEWCRKFAVVYYKQNAILPYVPESRQLPEPIDQDDEDSENEAF